MAATPPVSAADFKAQFDRDFKFGVGLDSVRDSDITKAFNNALAVFNTDLWETESLNLAFLYASAHFLVVGLQSAGGLVPVAGVGRGARNRSDGVTISKTVGAVSMSYVEPPPFVKNHAGLLPFWETEYGKMYCQLLGPRLIGASCTIAGEVDPGVYPIGGELNGG